jgi:transcriptional regulator with XRE-family HTH domain
MFSMTQQVNMVSASGAQNFSSLVRTYRKSMGWTQWELSERWGYSFETISAWERGKRSPSGVEIPRLAQLMGVEPRELAGLVARSKAQREGWDSGEGERRELAGVPFADGRLLWTLHLGVGNEGLQGVIACPLASGEVWMVPLDAEASQVLHQLVHAHISRGGAQ